MIRTTVVPRSARIGVAAASVLGIAALAGCSAPADGTDTSTGSSEAPTTSDAGYTDGSYTAEGDYVDGGGVPETVSVTVTLKDDVVTDVSVTGDAASPQSKQYQSAFIGGIAEVVEGKDIDDLSVSRVAGSSLTSGGFNEAIEKIKSEAAA